MAPVKCNCPQGREVFSSLNSSVGKKEEDISAKDKAHIALIKYYHYAGLAKKTL